MSRSLRKAELCWDLKRKPTHSVVLILLKTHYYQALTRTFRFRSAALLFPRYFSGFIR